MTYFISGHRDLTWEEFTKWYAPAISKVICTDKEARFVVGDCKAPRYLTRSCTLTQGGFTSDVERDAAMTEHSDRDIAFIRKGKESSGTAQNILRRWTK